MHSNKRVCAYISKSAIIKNIEKIRHESKNSKLMCVIKADGYGHGAVDFVQILDKYADYYAVAMVTEATELRGGGTKKPILVLGYTFLEEYEAAVLNDVTLTVFSLEDAKVLSKVAGNLRKTAKVHIAIDTGMGRIGFLPDENSAKEVKMISLLPNIEVEGVFTHFASSDEKDLIFTCLQTEKFAKFKEMLENLGVDVKLYHAANSAAIMQYKGALFDMVRAGIILYGLYPSDEVFKDDFILEPVMELHSRVSYVKTIKKGDSVSYGRTFVAPNDMKIATIPVGYADGYPRLLSNKGRVIINGKYAPIIGRICMDQFMVDVTDIENVCAGSKVILIGKENGLFVSADEIASIAGTINYEVVCGIGKRVPREVIE